MQVMRFAWLDLVAQDKGTDRDDHSKLKEKLAGLLREAGKGRKKPEKLEVEGGLHEKQVRRYPAR